MNDIPPDVMKIDNAILAGRRVSTEDALEWLYFLVDKAIAEERERCAQIADRLALSAEHEFDNMLGHSKGLSELGDDSLAGAAIWATVWRYARKISKAIRKGESLEAQKQDARDTDAEIRKAVSLEIEKAGFVLVPRYATTEMIDVASKALKKKRVRFKYQTADDLNSIAIALNAVLEDISQKGMQDRATARRATI
jgi:hypothetical protein